MSPLYVYRCARCRAEGEKLRKYEDRDRVVICGECKLRMKRIPAAHHQAVDGIYSYAPNEGNPDLPEKAAMRARGEKWDTCA